MTEQEIETAARSIFKSIYERYGQTPDRFNFEDLPSITQKHYFDTARAALESVGADEPESPENFHEKALKYAVQSYAGVPGIYTDHILNRATAFEAWLRLHA